VKGFKLKTLKGLNTRPTSDRVKGSIFSILGGYFDELVVLDLFSGSGNLGIEALSRGAKKAVFVDKSLDSTNVINDNLNKTWLKGLAKVVKMDVLSYLDKYQNFEERFDLIFIDPPYNDEILISVLKRLGDSDIISNDGLVVIEKHKNHLLAEKYGNLTKIKDKNYGLTSVVILQKKLVD
jgi:16S rRNA (guanine966-N2)-methyltransferase